MPVELPCPSELSIAVDAAQNLIEPCQYRRLRAALKSRAFISQQPNFEHGQLLVVIKDTSGSSVVTLWTVDSPETPWVTCTCDDSYRGHVFCKHACWVLLRACEHFDCEILDHMGRGFQESVLKAAATLQTPGVWRQLARPALTWAVNVSHPVVDCPICFEPTTGGVQCTACSAVYHRDCAVRWGKSCPMCREGDSDSGSTSGEEELVPQDWNSESEER